MSTEQAEETDVTQQATTLTATTTTQRVKNPRRVAAGRMVAERTRLAREKQNKNNKLVKTVIYAATITGLAVGIGWSAKKVTKEKFTSDPTDSAMNYVKFTAVVAGSIALKEYLEDQKILPTSV